MNHDNKLSPKADSSTQLSRHVKQAQAPFTSPKELIELSQNILRSAEQGLAWLTDGTEVLLNSEDLLDPAKRCDLTTAIQRKADPNIRVAPMDSQDITFALQTLVNSSLINKLEGYNPASDDVCVLAALSGAIVESAIEGGDVKSITSQTLISLIEHAADHALDMVLNQVKVLQESTDHNHKKIAEEVLVFIANYYITNEHSDNPDVRKTRDYEYRVLKQIANYTPSQIGSAIINCETVKIGQAIMDNVLLSSVLTEDKTLSYANLNMIKSICSKISQTANFECMEHIQTELIPQSEAVDIIEQANEATINTYDVIGDTNPIIPIPQIHAEALSQDDEF